MKRILVTGACGQIGSELIGYLRRSMDNVEITATDIKRPSEIIAKTAHFEYLNVVNRKALAKIVVDRNIDTIFHMAAILSATGEQNPALAYKVNMDGLMNVLETARTHSLLQVISPSTIAVFGPDSPKDQTPNQTPLNPTTMYGVTKVAGEKLMQYYYEKYGLDTRSLRYPGIISGETAPGGGTTDYAIDLYFKAAHGETYQCFLKQDTPLPFMYMPDAIAAIINLAKADHAALNYRVYNVGAMTLTPGQIVNEIRSHHPAFEVQYQPDYRQNIAESWPASIDDGAARSDWGWEPKYDLKSMTEDMFTVIKRRQLTETI